MRIRYYSCLWREETSHISTAWVPTLIFQAAQFALVLKYGLHKVTEWNSLFSTIMKCRQRLSSKVWACMMGSKTGLFSLKGAQFIPSSIKARRVWRIRRATGTNCILHHCVQWKTCNINGSLYIISHGLFLSSQPSNTVGMAMCALSGCSPTRAGWILLNHPAERQSETEHCRD